MLNPHRRKLAKADLLTAQIPEKYWKAELSDFPDNYAGMRVFRKFQAKTYEMVKDGAGLLILGQVGHGKTRIAVALLKNCLRYGATGCVIEANRMQRGIMDKDPDGDARPLLARLESVDALVLDDIGAEHGNEWLKVQIESLVRYRSARSKTTIITTNLKRSELTQVYGKPFSSILRETVYPVMVDGKDWREDQADKLRKRFE